MIKLISHSVLVISLTLIASAASAYGQSEQEERKGPPPFSKLDLDGDSLVTLDEFSQHAIPRGDHETVFNHIDSDDNGSITEDELLNHKPPRR